MRKKPKAILVNNIKKRNFVFFYRVSKKYILTHLSIIRNRPLTGPMLAIISPSYHCNLRCEMCNFWKKKGGRELEKEDFYKVMNELFDMHTPMISFSGGEPFLRKDIFELVKYASNNAVVHIASNGTRITGTIAKRIRELEVDGVSISLDSSNPEIHNKIRGVTNSFDHTLNGLKTLVKETKNSKTVIDVITLVTEDNFQEIFKTVQLVNTIGIDTVGIIPIHKLNQNVHRMDNRKKETVKNIEIVIDGLIKLKKEEGIIDNSIRYLEDVKKYFRGEPKSSSCSAGLTTCVIDSFGYVYPCYGYYIMQNAIDNIKDKSIKEIWFSEKYNRIRKDLFQCKKCLWNCHGEFDVLFKSAIKIREMIGN